MKCKICGYELRDGDNFCTQCGHTVKPENIECQYCHYMMEDGYNYCPNCGKEVINQKNCCKQCGYEIKEEDAFCPNCGTEITGHIIVEEVVESNETPVEYTGYVPIQKKEPTYVKQTVEEYAPIEENNGVDVKQPVETMVAKKGNDSSFWRNPILWIVSISLLVICLLLSQYMKEVPSSSGKKIGAEEKITEELADIGITKDTSTFVMQANANIGGTTYRYENNFYVSVDGAIYETNLEFDDAKKVVEEAGEYIYVDSTYIYYSDEDNNYQRVNRKTKEKEKVLENIYYARVIDDMLYYQSDSDGESIHVYNLSTKEDRKINNEKSYAMIVDTKNSIIYYTNEENVLKKINLDGTGSEVLLDKQIASFVYEEGYIYYSQVDGIGKFDVTSKEDTVLVSGISAVYVSLLEDKIVYGSYTTGLYTVNKDGSKKKVITTNYVQGFEVQGDIVVYSDATKGAIYGADKEANRTRIHEIKYEDSYGEDGSSNIDGIQEF